MHYFLEQPPTFSLDSADHSGRSARGSLIHAFATISLTPISRVGDGHKPALHRARFLAQIFLNERTGHSDWHDAGIGGIYHAWIALVTVSLPGLYCTSGLRFEAASLRRATPAAASAGVDVRKMPTLPL